MVSARGVSGLDGCSRPQNPDRCQVAPQACVLKLGRTKSDRRPNHQNGPFDREDPLKRLLSLILAPVLASIMLVAPGVAAANNTCTVPYCPAPKAVTFDATNVKSDSARLNGTVNANGSDTHYHFELGTKSGVYTINSTDGTIDGRKTGDQSVKVDVKSLSPNTKYFFRIVANNAGGTTDGAELSFTTSAGNANGNGNGNGNNGNGNNGNGNGQGNGGQGNGNKAPTIGAPSLTTPVVQNATTTIKQLT